MDESASNTSADLGAPAPETFADTYAILEDARGGRENTAIEKLWDRFVPGLKICLAGRIRHGLPPTLRVRLQAEFDDLLQQALTKGFSQLNRFEFRGPGSMLAWLAEILHNEVRNRVAFWKAERRDLSREVQASPVQQTGSGGAPEAASPGPGPATQLGITEQQEQIANALASIDERHYQILWLRFFGGASWAEIAEAVGAKSPDAVRMECAGKALPAFAVALSSAK